MNCRFFDTKAHCAYCLTHPEWSESAKERGAASPCPHGVKLETLDLPRSPAKKGKCLTCAEKKAQASKNEPSVS